MARARATDTDAVIEAAARVFRQKGYQNATIDDIAQAAGIAKPTVYRYAKSKRWLLDRIVGTVMQDLEHRVHAVLAEPAPPQQRLRDLVRVHVAAATEHRTFYAILLSEETELSPRTRKRFRSWARTMTEEFRDVLDECARADERADVVDHAIAANLVLTMLTSLHRWYDPSGPVAPDDLAEQILLVLSGILPAHRTVKGKAGYQRKRAACSSGVSTPATPIDR